VVGPAGVVLEVPKFPEVEFGGDLQPATCCDLVGVACSTFRQPNSQDHQLNHGEQAARDRSGDKWQPYPGN